MGLVYAFMIFVDCVVMLFMAATGFCAWFDYKEKHGKSEDEED